MNNLRKIREIYGITQEEISKAINVNRATVSMWENQEEKKASSSNLEKMSLFYGIAPEFFYQQMIDNTVKKMLHDNAQRQKEIEEKAEGKRHKTDDFSNMFSDITFDQALRRYMNATKLLLATAEDADIDKLDVALKINEKLGTRLTSIFEIRKKEESENDTLMELMGKIGVEE